MYLYIQISLSKLNKERVEIFILLYVIPPKYLDNYLSYFTYISLNFQDKTLFPWDLVCLFVQRKEKGKLNIFISFNMNEYLTTKIFI